ncbi:TLC domain-containing protein 4 [Hippopotamus amphibius kiboko]|uniref:TLC domain-containing protein 4 n=1 Tax=Hippopotamus amphibius kiboko TaxID=575201 RepID=UPI002593AF52|nr:TLC domain-containing protein 4 [Hippopotamus amphibius kiboko]XP_057574208.1 TLC domain-containing protein 4 [Hippopotamus amphibius kiboko]XP_057574219.1 TLC domain-containing protein 4 [Hippopotamus amphibius kiboko]XP_057574229.1 TLC domain-containing protein 4 [Hippopotamus amphibius kiboko]XP_057574239.1 TLC domain-containing protein 4 [Hippopotamus amphibius kiboko]XP_057574249.1 TLC domain-containing protein 4 [Hippopotamus amphibius kiboko]XP_057574258.1 TLC domain-containing prot
MDTNTILVISAGFTSFFTFQLLFHFLSYWFSAKVSPGFNNLNFEKKIEWNSRVVSTCHSLVVGVFGLYIILFDEATIADPLWGDPSLVKVNIAIASGYLISDLLVLICYWRVIGDKYFIIHHCAALYAYYFVLRDGVLGYIANFRLLSELSSPFVNLRWFFEALKYPKFSKANVANGILMTVVFFIVRIASIPPFYGYIYSVLGTDAYVKLGFLIQCSWISTCVVLDVLNVMWMIKISKGCVKVISLIRQEKAKKSLQNGKLN